MLIRKKIVKVVAEHFFLIIRVFVWLCVFRYSEMIDGGGNFQFRFLSRRGDGEIFEGEVSLSIAPIDYRCLYVSWYGL